MQWLLTSTVLTESISTFSLDSVLVNVSIESGARYLSWPSYKIL